MRQLWIATLICACSSQPPNAVVIVNVSTGGSSSGSVSDGEAGADSSGFQSGGAGATESTGGGTTESTGGLGGQSGAPSPAGSGGLGETEDTAEPVFEPMWEPCEQQLTSNHVDGYQISEFVVTVNEYASVKLWPNADDGLGFSTKKTGAQAPFVVMFNNIVLPFGSHSIRVDATDGFGNRAESLCSNNVVP